jgi:hypothetical protein
MWQTMGANWVISMTDGKGVVRECDDVKSLKKAKKPFAGSGRP